MSVAGPLGVMLSVVVAADAAIECLPAPTSSEVIS